ncbi:MAG: AAA family ATPase, partial [Microgenomates group bacterium]
MNKKISQFFPIYFKNLSTAIFNLYIFFPYFFSIKILAKTLFYPWKNLIYTKKAQFFSFSQILEAISFNLISRTIGFFARFSLILFWFFLQLTYTISLPFIFLFFILISPIFFLFNLFSESEEEKKKKQRENFIKFHLLSAENKEKVKAWFEDYYQEWQKLKRWYLKENLFQIPPLARDWAYGYTYNLNQFCEELTTAEYLSSKTAVVDREKEITQIEDILIKSRYNNVLIVGEDGVGKHTIVDALAYRVYHGITQKPLMYHRILKLNMEKILTTFNDQIKREEFFDQLLSEASQAKNIIIFIDKIDRYLAGDDYTRVDLSIPIEKYAKTSLLQIIGITTPFFYQKIIFPNDKINQIFTKVNVEEITPEIAEKILLKLIFNFENKYQLAIPYETIKNAIIKSNFYLTYIPFPEKAIDLIDLACAKAKKEGKKILHPLYVDLAIMEKTHIPTIMTEEIKNKLLHLEENLKQKIFGQEEAMIKIASAVKQAFILAGKRKKPIGSFLFLGPTGVGKTETAKILSQVFFGSEKYLLRFDMSLYQTKEDIEKLIGSYQTKDPGLLTQTIRENPYGVLLLDEIEKTHPDLLNIFLTILDEGYFTDSFGKRVDCKNLVIIATSNAGSDLMFKQEKVEDTNFLINYLIEKKIFTPEFLNRFDALVFYKPLKESDFLLIAKKAVALLKKEVFNLYNVEIEVSDEYLLKLIKEKLDFRFGARNLQRLLKEEIEKQVVDSVLNN